VVGADIEPAYMSSAKVSRTLGFSVAIVAPVLGDPLLTIGDWVVIRLVGDATTAEVAGPSMAIESPSGVGGHHP
jgi:hypothetical protein